MDSGGLRCDETKKELSEKVARAVAYYTWKYGLAPTLCFVNPKRLKQAELMGSLQVRPTGKVLAQYFLGPDTEAPAPVTSPTGPRRKKMDVQS